MNSAEITVFLISISIMLLLARGLGEILRLIKQPIIIGEIFAGIILGPTLLGNIFPGIYDTLFESSDNNKIALEGITNLAVVMLMLVSGLEVDLTIMLKQGKLALLTSIMGIIVPFGLGFGASYIFPEFMGIKDESMILVFSLFIGTALSITALPVVARTLMDLNIFRSEMGLIIIASAMLNDLVGWIIFSVILSMLGTSGHGLSFGTTVTSTFLFIFITLLIGRKIIHKILPMIQEKLTFPGGVLNFILILGFLSAAFTEYIGIHAIFGAFIIGVAVGDSASLKESTREIIHQFVTNIFAPLFFVSIGLRVNFIEYFDLTLVLVFITLAFIGKVVGCGFGSYLGGAKKNDAMVIGFGMNSRGAMEIILGILALEFGLIQEKVFVALVIMALVTSVSSAPLMNLFLAERRKASFSDLLKLKNIFISKAADKKTILNELVNNIYKEINIPKDILLNEILKREELIPTGIANCLAIPHAKVDIKKTVVSVAVNFDGLDFEAADGEPSKIIILLLTPKNENELQLKLLAEIANLFAEKSRAEEIIECKTPEEILNKLQSFSKKEN